MRRTLVVLVSLLSLFFIFGCERREDNPLSDIDIDAIDQLDIAAGLYEIPFTIEDLETLATEYNAVVEIIVTDSNNQPVDIFGQSIDVIAGEIYTAIIRITAGDFFKEKTITITAVAELPVDTVTVTYDFNAREMESWTVDVLRGSKLTEPNAPTQNGYLFIGWFRSLEGDDLFDFENEIIDEAITLYAHWDVEPVQAFMITYYLNDGTNDVFHTGFNMGDTLVFVDMVPTREGFTFIGWYYDNALKTQAFEDETITQALVLYAGWQENALLTVTFVVNNGIDDPVQISVMRGELLDQPEPFYKNGYDFIGWSIEEDTFVAFDFSTAIIEDITLYAIWESNQTTFNVTYFMNDGTEIVFFEDVTIGDVFYMISDEPIREGFVFSGWYNDIAGLSPQASMEVVSADLVLYAGWVEATIVTLSFVMGTLEVEQTPPQTLAIGAFGEYPMPDPWRLEYTFLGWFLDLSNDVLFDFETTPIYEDTILYAKWISIYGSVFEVTYRMNDGTNDVFMTDNVSEGPLFLIGYLPTREGFVFVGWFLDELGETPAENGYFIDQAVTIYAKWTQGGTLLEAPQNVVFNDGIVSFDPYPLVNGQVTAIAFHIYLNDVHSATAFTNSYDISFLLQDSGTYVIEIIAIGDGVMYLNSAKSDPIDVVIEPVELQTHFTYFVNGGGQGVTVTGLTEAGIEAVLLSLELIIPRKIGREYVTVIGAGAFDNLLGMLNDNSDDEEQPYIYSFSNVVIPNTVKIIEQSAFSALVTESLTLSDSLEIIGVMAFMGLSGIDHLILPQSVIEIHDAAFYGAWQIKSVYFGQHLVSIGANAFADCGEIETITFSILNEVFESIGNDAFSSAWSLIEIYLPNSTLSIGENAFSFATSLYLVFLGNNIEFIGGDAFNGCESLRYVISYATQAPELGSAYVFPKNQNITFPNQFQTDSHWAPYFEPQD